MELKDLVGKHILDAVDFSSEKNKDEDRSFENCSVMRFRLDGVVYVVTEDPEDGYRSSMKEIKISNDVIMNIFTPIEVIGQYIIKSEDDPCREDDILKLVDIKTLETVIEVGTKNIDDYYPYFIANFTPEAMYINK